MNIGEKFNSISDINTIRYIYDSNDVENVVQLIDDKNFDYTEKEFNEAFDSKYGFEERIIFINDIKLRCVVAMTKNSKKNFKFGINGAGFEVYLDYEQFTKNNRFYTGKRLDVRSVKIKELLNNS